MPINFGNDKNVLSITLLDLRTGNKTTLFEREGSRCHFYDDIYLKDYIITLRIDWGDIRNNDPVLDADIYRNISGKKGKKLRYGPWHHTLKEFDENSNRKLYDFTFNELRLTLSATMTFSLSVGIDAILENSDSSDNESNA
jgi:hypothetical protein